MATVLLLAGAALWALAVGWVAAELTAVATDPRPDWRLPDGERQRRAELRSGRRTYRWFEPLVDALAGWNRRLWPARVRRLQHDLDLLGAGGWRADEFLAVRQLEAVPVFFAGTLAGYVLFGTFAAPLVGLLALAAAHELLARRTAKLARRHKQRVRSRLPYVLDLMALMVEGGADFHACLETTAREDRGDPTGEEFGRVHRSIERGTPRAAALQDMARRLDDGDVNELVFTLNTSEDLGTPLKQALRTMAEQMRGRRVQRLERGAEEAKVHITWPAMVVMVACLLLVAAPLLLEGLGG